jgi:plasmid stability protein
MLVNQNMPRGLKVAKRQKAESIHDRDRIIVRLPDGMRDKIATMAAANGRSMTAEVIAALDQHLKGADRITQLWDLFEKNRKNIEEIPQIWDAIQNLEWQVERVTGASLSGIRAARKAAEKGES